MPTEILMSFGISLYITISIFLSIPLASMFYGEKFKVKHMIIIILFPPSVALILLILLIKCFIPLIIKVWNICIRNSFEKLKLFLNKDIIVQEKKRNESRGNYDKKIY